MNLPKPFEISAEQPFVDLIATKISRYRWPPVPANVDWSFGTDEAILRALIERWQASFNWRKEEAEINRNPQFTVQIEDITVHFVHRLAQGKVSSTDEPPIVLMHGWPSSFVEYLEVAERLAEPARGEPGRDVVIVSLPGFGFSSGLKSFMGPRRMAGYVHTLITEILRYPTYIAHGSDLGSIIAGWLGFDYPNACAGVHMTMVSPRFIAASVTSTEEQQWLAKSRDKFEDDGAYFKLQTSRPVTLGFVLGDSPVGLLAWMTEKFAAWSDPAAGDLSFLFRQPELADRILRNVMLYLVSGTVETSTWVYRGLAMEDPPGYPDKRRVEVPVAIAATRDGVFAPPPKSLVEKAYRVVRWTEYQAGGHFPAYDVPDLLLSDIRAFAATL